MGKTSFALMVTLICLCFGGAASAQETDCDKDAYDDALSTAIDEVNNNANYLACPNRAVTVPKSSNRILRKCCPETRPETRIQRGRAILHFKECRERFVRILQLIRRQELYGDSEFSQEALDEARALTLDDCFDGESDTDNSR